MKKLCKALCSLLFATAIALPVNTMASSPQESDDTADEQVTSPAEEEAFNVAFLNGDFGLHYSREGMADQLGTLLMFLCGPDGKIVKNAQVITTIIDQNGTQTMRRARPLKGGFLIDTERLLPGQYRLEAEIITAGWLLTDELHFQKA